MDRDSPLQLKGAATLSEALKVGPRDLVALVGGGGKTTAMYRLVGELRERGICAMAATTTKIAVPSMSEAQLVLGSEWPVLKRNIAAARQATVVIGRRRIAENKVEGIPGDWCSRLIAEGIVESLVVEADGSARRPVKAPAEWEPVVPQGTTIFVAVIGLSCVGMAITAENVFRPDRVVSVTGLRPGDRLNPEALGRLLMAEEGAYKGCPAGARAYVLLNQADGPQDEEAARRIAERVLKCGSGYRGVVAVSLRRKDSVRGVWER